MGEERLLERIRTWRNEPKRRSRGEVSRQIDSIVAHLQRILNTRQGNVPIADGYGVPDLTDFMLSYPESVTEIEKSLRQAIEEYEPRLRSVRVSFVHQEDDLLCLRFQIVAQLLGLACKNPGFVEPRGGGEPWIFFVLLRNGNSGQRRGQNSQGLCLRLHYDKLQRRARKQAGQNDRSSCPCPFRCSRPVFTVSPTTTW